MYSESMARTLIRTKNYALQVMRANLPNGVKKRVTYIRFRPNVIAVLPVLNNGKLALALEYRPLLKSYIYSVVTGKVNRGETYARAAARELGEETGYHARRLRLLFKFYILPGQIRQNAVHAFIATGLDLRKSNPEIDEIIKVEAVQLNKALQSIKSGKIIDLTTIATVLFYASFAKRDSL